MWYGRKIEKIAILLNRIHWSNLTFYSKYYIFNEYYENVIVLIIRIMNIIMH